MEHHYRDKILVGHGPTVREINYLCQLFEHVTHLGCLHTGAGPSYMSPYSAKNIEFLPLPPAGGKTLWEKLGILWLTPKYLYAIWNELNRADIVHVRCPANIPLLALLILIVRRHPTKRWIKFAGNWQPNGHDAWSYRLQRWLLKKNFQRAEVSVNGYWEDSPKHIHAFLNPCLNASEISAGQSSSADKKLSLPVRLLYVGRVEEAKGVGRILEIVHELYNQNIDFRLIIIGDGLERPHFEAQCRKLAIEHFIEFTGWISRETINNYYKWANFIVFPSLSEGWPKVLSEGMAFGAVPLASNVSSIPQYLSEFTTGQALEATNINAFVEAIIEYIEHPELWKKESNNAVEAAITFSYSAYLKRVQSLLKLRNQ